MKIVQRGQGITVYCTRVGLPGQTGVAEAMCLGESKEAASIYLCPGRRTRQIAVLRSRLSFLLASVTILTTGPGCDQRV